MTCEGLVPDQNPYIIASKVVFFWLDTPLKTKADEYAAN